MRIEQLEDGSRYFRSIRRPQTCGHRGERLARARPMYDGQKLLRVSASRPSWRWAPSRSIRRCLVRAQESRTRSRAQRPSAVVTILWMLVLAAQGARPEYPRTRTPRAHREGRYREASPRGGGAVARLWGDWTTRNRRSDGARRRVSRGSVWLLCFMLTYSRRAPPRSIGGAFRSTYSGDRPMRPQLHGTSLSEDRPVKMHPDSSRCRSAARS